LRWLSDIDISKLFKSIGKCQNILLVDECRQKGCYLEGLYASLANESKIPLKIKLHAADDSFISIGKASNVTLPSKESIIKNALELINE